jgi:hypothetical protein
MPPNVSKFEKLDPEMREEWRRHFATDAFLALVVNERERLKEALALAVQSPTEDLNYVRLVGGEIKALDHVLFLANREPVAAAKEKGRDKR